MGEKYDFDWEGLSINLQDCDLEEKNSDWLNAIINFDGETSTLLVDGYINIIDWWEKLSSFVLNKTIQSVEIGISYVLKICIIRIDQDCYDVSIELSDDPLLEMYSRGFICDKADLLELMKQSESLKIKYAKMIGEA